MEPKLNWLQREGYQEATIGDYYAPEHDGVRFSIQFYSTCYRRGRHRLLIEIGVGPNHEKWGCFDEADQPQRWYHLEENAKSEAEAIATVLLRDRWGLEGL